MKLSVRSIITKSSAQQLELEISKETFGIVTATNIPLAVNSLFQAIAGRGYA